MIGFLSIRFNFNNRHVLSTVYPTEQCNIEANYCILPTATIIWDKDVRHVCDLHNGSTVMAELALSREGKAWSLVSEEGQIALTGQHREEVHCGNTLMVSNEGVYIKLGSRQTAKVMHVPEISHDASSTNIMGTIFYMGHYLEDLTVRLFKQNWMSICNIQRQNYYWLKHLMSNSQTAYLAGRMLLKTANIYAYPAGQFLQVHECQIINEYYWTPLLTKCYATIPVQFGNNKTGFFIPATNDIKTLDATQPCTHDTQQYLRTNNNITYVWNGSTLATAHVPFTTIELVQQMPNVSYIQLIASHVYDPLEDAIDSFSVDMTSMTQTVLTLMRAAGTDVVTFDPQVITNAAGETVFMMRGVVDNALDSISPLLRWIRLIIILSVVIASVILFVVIIMRVRKGINQRKSTRMLNEILQLNRARDARNKAHDNRDEKHYMSFV